MSEETRLADLGMVIKMIPTPRGISSECGFSIRLESDDLAITQKLTEKNHCIERIYLQYMKERSKAYEEIYRR